MKLMDKQMYTYFREWQNTEKRKDRGSIISEVACVWGIDKSTVHRNFTKLKDNKSMNYRRDKGAPRLKIDGEAVTAEDAKIYAAKVASLRNCMATKSGRAPSTELLVRALFNRGEIPCEFSRSTMDRWLNKNGLSYNQIRNYNESTYVRLRSRHPNECWVVDASVSELYYLKDNDRLVKDDTGIITDKNHREEILTKKGYRKLWLFCFVDLYSKAFYYKAYVTPGESALVWLKALVDAFLEKSDINNPFRGIPEIIYSDRGSALISNAVDEVFSSFGIEHITHKAGNPKAKGMVESRIGKIKSRIERCMSLERIGSVDRYNELAEKFIVSENMGLGSFELWSEIHRQPGLLREFSHEAKGKLGYVGETRTVNAYGCITVGNDEWYVDRKLKGEKVEIIVLFDGTMKAVSRFQRTYELVNPEFQERYIGEFEAEKKSEYDKVLETIEAEGKRLKGIVKPEDFINDSPGKNVVMFDKPGVKAEIRPIIDDSAFSSVDDAWYQILRQSGYGKTDIPADIAETIDSDLREILAENNGIARELVYELIDFISDFMTEANVL